MVRTMRLEYSKDGWWLHMQVEHKYLSINLDSKCMPGVFESLEAITMIPEIELEEAKTHWQKNYELRDDAYKLLGKATEKLRVIQGVLNA